MNRSTIVVAVATAGMGLSAACNGVIGDGGSGVGQAQGNLCAVDTPIRRLTHFEYDNTVRDLLGDTTQPARAFPTEDSPGTFDNQANKQNVGDLLADHYMKASEAMSESATANIGALIPYCSEAANGTDACGAQFIETFGKRAFRRPLAEDEKARFKALFDWAMADPEIANFADAVEVVIQAMLQSPHFLYRPEFGFGDPVELDVVQLNGWEMASRLSYLFWNSMPDDELLRAAEAGELGSRENLAAQARRMLADGKAKDAIRSFHQQWLLLHELDAVDKDPVAYPNYAETLKPLWQQEIERFVEHAILEDDGSLRTLLGASYSFMNAELAAFYGIDAASAPTSTTFEKVSTDPSQRAGLLTMSALMAALAEYDRSSPVFRGKFVREQLLCMAIPPPPMNLQIVPPSLDPTMTTREQFEPIGANPDCSFCHLLMNPIGFGFENYDAIGLWRDTQNSKPIDATGEIINGGDVNGAFNGAVDLAGKLAASEEVAACVSSQWFRFGYGRSVTAQDKCSTEQLLETFVASDFNIRELLVALTQTDAFLFRHIVVAEGGAP